MAALEAASHCTDDEDESGRSAKRSVSGQIGALYEETAAAFFVDELKADIVATALR